MKWTEKEIPDLRGKIAVVTGANCGLGFQTALLLAKHGCHVVMACRNLEKAKQAMEDIVKVVPLAQLEIMQLDLADLHSISEFCNRMKATHKYLSLLINNAAVLNVPHGETKDGFEIIFGTNHCGPFALTAQLFPLLQAADEARIVTVSSNSHKFTSVQTDDFTNKTPGHQLKTYAKSKLANLLFAFELDRRLKAINSNVISVATHPGYAATKMNESRGDNPNCSAFTVILTIAKGIFAQSAHQGALPTLYAATDPKVKSGEFYGPSGLTELRGHPTLLRCSDNAYDEAVAKKLWEDTENLTHIKFDISSVLKMEDTAEENNAISSTFALR